MPIPEPQVLQAPTTPRQPPAEPSPYATRYKRRLKTTVTRKQSTNRPRARGIRKPRVDEAPSPLAVIWPRAPRVFLDAVDGCQLLSTHDAAMWVNKSERTIKRWIAEGWVRTRFLVDGTEFVELTSFFTTVEQAVRNGQGRPKPGGVDAREADDADR